LHTTAGLKVKNDLILMSELSF